MNIKNTSSVFCAGIRAEVKLLCKLYSCSKHRFNFAKIRQAISFAKKYHGDQKRDSGEPFYSHPLIIATMVLDHCQDTDIVITAILHDVIEDTGATFRTVKEVFGQKIAKNVMDLTRNKRNGTKISAAALLEKLVRENKQDLAIVKLLDRIHNMSTVGIDSPKIHKILAEKSIFISIAQSINVNIANQIQMLCV